MKEAEFVINSNNVIDVTFLQAFSYLEEAEQMINNSSFNLYLDEEDLDEFSALKRYNEKNRRLTQLGQSCEYFLKTVLLIEGSLDGKKNNVNLSLEQLWNKKMRGHKIELLFDKIEQKNVAFKDFFSRVIVDTDENFLVGQDLFEILTRNSDVYEKSRYNMEKKTDYNLMEVLKLTKQIAISTIMFYNKYKGGNIKIRDDVYGISSSIISELELELSFLGFSDVQCKKILKNFNKFKLKYFGLEKYINDVSIFSKYDYLLTNCCLSSNEFKKIFSELPSAFILKDTYLAEKINYLIDNDLRFLLIKYPEILMMNLSDLTEKINYLIDNDLRFLLIKCPKIIMMSLSHLKTRLYFLELNSIKIDENNYNILLPLLKIFCKRLNVSTEDFYSVMQQFSDEKGLKKL